MAEPTRRAKRTKTRSTKAVSNQRRAKIIELHQAGLTNNRIAARLGITQPAVSYHLRCWRRERTDAQAC